jgi:FAD/FMN-containing dehydrogenase
MTIAIGEGDETSFARFNRGSNSRFPESSRQGASTIMLCENTGDILEALKQCVSKGLRPTIRSGGHCYEGFVYNNPGGVVIDLRHLSGVSRLTGSGKFRIDAGAQLGGIYRELYKKWNVTIPGGSCLEVGAGGHIAGGGYGFLSRMYGLTSDWLTGVDVIGVTESGRIIMRHADDAHYSDLLRACRGAGGGNFGIISSYYFDELPPPPKEVLVGRIVFKWADLSKDAFARLLQLYSEYWETCGQAQETWGLFTILNISHCDSGYIAIQFQYCDASGIVAEAEVLEDFIGRFSELSPAVYCGVPSARPDARAPRVRCPNHGCAGDNMTSAKSAWFPTIFNPALADNSRQKFKSAYMKRPFSHTETSCLYEFMSNPITGVDLSRACVLVDSYGGAVNQPMLGDQTAVFQRSSIMKLQFVIGWDRPSDDCLYMQWLDKLYTQLYSLSTETPEYSGAPYPGERYEGCYINYPDIDMLRFPHWADLYYGADGLYSVLRGIKRQYDSQNIFRHAMSIRP